MKTSRRIILLKCRATKAYKRFRAIQDEYDCGLEIALTLSKPLRDAREIFNSTMNELAKIDPETPATRL